MRFCSPCPVSHAPCPFLGHVPDCIVGKILGAVGGAYCLSQAIEVIVGEILGHGIHDITDVRDVAVAVKLVGKVLQFCRAACPEPVEGWSFFGDVQRENSTENLRKENYFNVSPPYPVPF